MSLFSLFLARSPSTSTNEIICACFLNAVSSRKIDSTSSRIGASRKERNGEKYKTFDFHFSFRFEQQKKSYKMILNFTLRFKCQTMCEEQWTLSFFLCKPELIKIFREHKNYVAAAATRHSIICDYGGVRKCSASTVQKLRWTIRNCWLINYRNRNLSKLSINAFFCSL